MYENSACFIINNCFPYDFKIVDTRYIAKATEDMSKTINVSKEENTVEIKQPLKVPLIMQEPELMRGCEVTSLAMILQYNHINVDKMELSKNINHVPFYR